MLFVLHRSPPFLNQTHSTKSSTAALSVRATAVWTIVKNLQKNGKATSTAERKILASWMETVTRATLYIKERSQHQNLERRISDFMTLSSNNNAPYFFLLLLPKFSRRHRKSHSLVFFAPRLYGNACYASYNVPEFTHRNKMSQINTWSDEIMRELENDFVTNFHVKKCVAEGGERKRTLDNVYGTLRKFCERTRRVSGRVSFVFIFIQ